MEHTRKRLNKSQLPHANSEDNIDADDRQSNFGGSVSNASIEMYGNGIPSNLPGIPVGPGRAKKAIGLDRNGSQSKSAASLEDGAVLGPRQLSGSVIVDEEVGEGGPDFNGMTAAKHAGYRPSDLSGAHDQSAFHTNATLDGRLDSSQLKLMDTT